MDHNCVMMLNVFLRESAGVYSGLCTEDDVKLNKHIINMLLYIHDTTDLVRWLAKQKGGGGWVRSELCCLCGVCMFSTRCYVFLMGAPGFLQRSKDRNDHHCVLKNVVNT